MGMRIDDEIYVHGYLDEIRQDKVIVRNEGGYFGTVVDELVEAIPKADYENRLKADMVAMLTKLKEEISDYHEIGCDKDCNNCRMVACIEPANVIKDLNIIQQKINELKGEKDDKDN